ncbi:MAG: tRNA (adenosine(37)-N6)-threonylcarbamoyltransferase complex dimerization subunit type 1 TsaB [Eubacteriales bacterium]|nr:tRNA (adenosine(37)-N6)-threonylcarbamoyltransferase complex dimerization subunit type 1 TsaB [Eubacteriales bacterium]
MKVLAFDSSGLVASVALLEDRQLIAEYTLNYKKTHSQTLLPMLDEIIQMTGFDLKEIDALAIAAGPGSFTGLRIGSATVKGLGMALDKPVISVPTLEGLAMNLWGADAVICPMMDARRKQVYTGIYEFEQGRMQVLEEQTACPVEEILQKCRKIGRKIIFCGDGVPVYEDIIREQMEGEYSLAPAHVNRQRAAAVGVRAFDYWKEGKVETAADHGPVYLRKSQAERELAAKGKKLP